MLALGSRAPLHLQLYLKRAQGLNTKYSDKWLATGSLGVHVWQPDRDNVFWSLVGRCASFGPATRPLTLWAFSNHIIPTSTYNLLSMQFF